MNICCLPYVKFVMCLFRLDSVPEIVRLDFLYYWMRHFLRQAGIPSHVLLFSDFTYTFLRVANRRSIGVDRDEQPGTFRRSVLGCISSFHISFVFYDSDFSTPLFPKCHIRDLQRCIRNEIFYWSDLYIIYSHAKVGTHQIREKDISGFFLGPNTNALSSILPEDGRNNACPGSRESDL